MKETVTEQWTPIPEGSAKSCKAYIYKTMGFPVRAPLHLAEEGT